MRLYEIRTRCIPFGQIKCLNIVFDGIFYHEGGTEYHQVRKNEGEPKARPKEASIDD